MEFYSVIARIKLNRVRSVAARPLRCDAFGTCGHFVRWTNLTIGGATSSAFATSSSPLELVSEDCFEQNILNNRDSVHFKENVRVKKNADTCTRILVGARSDEMN